MILKSPHFATLSNPRSEALAWAIEVVSAAAQHRFLALEDPSDMAQGFLQALLVEDGWCVEANPGFGERFYRLRALVDRCDVQRMFVAFLRDGTVGVLDEPWEDVTENVRESIRKWAGKGNERRDAHHG